MDEKISWEPLYSELAHALLRYKADRKPLVKWIYDELGKITNVEGHPFIGYLKQKDGSRITDIDPFSVFGIFNRNLKHKNRIALLGKFKEHLELRSELPVGLDGIPTLDPRKSFFFSWEDDNNIVIRDQWALFERVVDGNDDIADAFDRVLDNGMPQNSLTMCLYWIAPKRFLSLDSTNRHFLENWASSCRLQNSSSVHTATCCRK